jgi:hypothetical protein
MYGAILPPFSGGGDGRAATPYKIANLNDLKILSTNSSYWAAGKYFEQTADIDASSTSTLNSGAGFSPIGNGTISFEGNYNGDGHTISGLYINRPVTDYVGLFGSTALTATIRNLGLLTSTIYGNSSVGGLVGNLRGAVSKCYSTGSVIGSANDIGGLIGYNYGSIANCYSTCSVSGTINVAGLLGYNLYGTVSFCYSTGAVSATMYGVGLVGRNDSGTVGNSYWDTESSGKATGGGGTGKTTAEMKTQATFSTWDFAANWKIDGTTNNGYPYLVWLAPAPEIDVKQGATTIIDATSTYDFGSKITATNTDIVFTIENTGTAVSTLGSFTLGGTNADQFSLQGTNPTTVANASSTTFTIRFTPTSAGSKTATVSFDNQDADENPYNFTITGTGVTPYPGLGAGTQADPYQIATLADLRFLSENNRLWAADTYFIQTDDIDATATNTWNVGNHDNNAVTPTVAMGFSSIGNFSEKFYGNYDGQDHSITGLYINRPATSSVGLFGSTANNSNLSNIKLINCNIAGNSYVGAIVGRAYGRITNCSSTGSVSGLKEFIGGLIGESRSDVTNSYSSCTVSGVTEIIGGFLGSAIGNTVTNCFSTGDVTANSGSTTVGGFAGYIEDATVSNCYSTSKVNLGNYVGGFAGFISSNNSSIVITNCYSTGNVTGINVVGGFIGLVNFTDGSVSNCYSRSFVNGTTNVNGFTGYLMQGTFTNCYFDADIDGIDATISGTDNGAIGKSTAEMKTLATFTGWDFPTIWKIASDKNYGYPYLAWQVFPLFSGGAGTQADPYKIATLADLEFLCFNSAYWAAGKYFIQTADIDASTTSGWSRGDGFSPIGSGSVSFDGNYDGQNHTITGLYINRPATEYIGLFGNISSTTVLSNIKLINCNLTGVNYIGALVGNGNGTVSNCSSTGTISGTGYLIGGLAGEAGGSFTNCNSSCIVSSVSSESNVRSNIGGIFGDLYGAATNCYSTGAVNATLANNVGGFMGSCMGPTIANCFSTSNVSGKNNVGGFTGIVANMMNPVNITNSYATGAVTGTNSIGGFVGTTDFDNGTISKCYSRSVVTLRSAPVPVPSKFNSPIMKIDRPTAINGFVGNYTLGTITNCYFDADVDGLVATISGTSNNGATGKTTAEMKMQATFDSWDFPTIWKIESNKNYGYPYLAWQTNVSVQIAVDTDTDASTITNSETADLTVTGTNTVFTVKDPKTFNSVTVEPGAKLDLTNALTITGDLIFKADETGSFNAKVGNAVTLATDSKVKYVKTMLDTKWYFLSFPCTVNIAEITQVGGGAFVLGQDWYIKYYNGQTRATNRGGKNWVAITDQITGTLTANQGYIIGLKTGVGTQQLSFVLDNAIVKTAETSSRPVGVSVWDAAAGTHAGWNLVGQPYLSRFAGNKITGAPQGVTIPDAINGMTYTQPTMASATFEPFSAYFVQVLADGDMSFDIAGRSSAPAAVATDLSDRVQLNFTSATGVDYTNLIMDNDQTTAYQIGQDLEKWIGTDTDKPQIYTQLGGVNYGYNALPMTDVQNLPVGIYTKTAGTTTISASAGQAPSLSKLLLFDSSNGTTTDLLISSYSFIADAGTNNTRFTITAQRISTENVVETETGCPTLAINNYKLIINNLSGKTAVRVYDAVGRMVASKTTSNSTVEMPVNVAGMYTVLMEVGAKSWVRKVVVR